MHWALITWLMASALGSDFQADKVYVAKDKSSAILFLSGTSQTKQVYSGVWPFRTMMVISCEREGSLRSLSWESPTDGTGAWSRVELLPTSPFLGKPIETGTSEFHDTLREGLQPKQITDFLAFASQEAEKLCEVIR